MGHLHRPSGNIYVADWGNNRVQKFSPTGELLVKFEGSSTGVGSLKGPSGVAVDSDGDVYVTDWGTTESRSTPPTANILRRWS